MRFLLCPFLGHVDRYGYTWRSFVNGSASYTHRPEGNFPCIRCGAKKYRYHRNHARR